MLSTETALIALLFACLLTLCVALASVIIARSARNYAAAWARWAQDNAESSVVANLSAEMTELTDAYDALLKSHKRLRSRITMRENREKKNGAGTDAELHSGDDKRALRLAAKAAGYLK